MGNRYWGRMKCAPTFTVITDGTPMWFKHVWNEKIKYYGKPIGELVTVSRHHFPVIFTQEGKTFIVRSN